MNDPEGSKYPKQSEYIRSSGELKRSIAINSSDFRFAQRKHTKIVYIFDTNICETYLTPGRALLPKGRGYDGLFKGDAAQTMERLTARFLFEGHLPGQNKESVFLSPPHWNETIRRLSELEREIKKGISIPIDELTTRLERLRSYRDKPNDLLTVAEDEGFADVLRKMASAASLNKRLRTLWGDVNFNKPRVRSLDTADFWSEAVDHINRQDFKFWQLKLAEERKSKGKSKKKRQQIRRNDQNLDNDAMTLAAIQALYREHDRATGPNPTLRFLFVTADASLISAVEKNHARLDKEGIHHFVRSPSIYMPFINYEYLHEALFEDEGDFDESEDLISDIRSAVTAVTLSHEDSLPQFSRSVIDFEQNIDRWSRLADLIAIMGTRYFKEDFEEDQTQVRQIAELFESDEVVEAAIERLNTRILDIRADHTRQLASAAIERLSKRVEVGAMSPQNQELRRAPLRILDADVIAPLKFSKNASFKNIKSLEEFLNKLSEKSASDASVAHAAILELKNAWNIKEIAAETYLLASCIYFSVGSWESAKLCADICIRRLRQAKQFKGVNLREARYCKALSSRMLLTGFDTFNEARFLLTSNMADYEKNSLAYERDKIERSALVLTACIVQTLDGEMAREPRKGGSSEVDSEFLEELDIPQEFELAVTETRDAVAAVEHSFMGYEDTAVNIAVQGSSNLLGASIFGFFLNISGTNISSADIENDATKLTELLSSTGSKPRFTAQLYLKAAELITQPERQKFLEFEQLVDSIQSSQVDLTWSDREEHEYLRMVMKRRASIF